MHVFCLLSPSFVFPLIHFTSPMVKDRYDSQNPQLETHRSKKTRFYLQLCIYVLFLDFQSLLHHAREPCGKSVVDSTLHSST